MSAVVPAYNYERYVERAVQSALDQDYPPDRLEVVVVDDGSTDGTADVVRSLAERNPGRVRLIRQPNAGYIGATSRALREARGELLALLDADDLWSPHKTRTQVTALRARPELGMVACDMTVIDGEDAVVRESVDPAIGEVASCSYARILRENLAGQSSIIFRRALLERVCPIPAGVPFADWWIALRCAQFSAVARLGEPLAQYRVHGGNLSGGLAGERLMRELRKELQFQRHALINLPIDPIGTDALEYVWEGLESKGRNLILTARSHFIEPLEVTAAQRTEAAGVLEEAERRRAAGDVEGEAALTLRALALDPTRLGLRQRLAEAVARARAASAAPDPLDGAEGFVLLADVEDLQRDEAMLLAFAEHLAGAEDVVLAVDASRLPVADAGEQLEALVGRADLQTRDDVRLLAIVGERDEAQRHRLLRRAGGLYRPTADDASPIPIYTPETLARLAAVRGVASAA